MAFYKHATTKPEPRIFTIDQQSNVFTVKFDQIQEDLETLASMDELLSG